MRPSLEAIPLSPMRITLSKFIELLMLDSAIITVGLVRRYGGSWSREDWAMSKLPVCCFKIKSGLSQNCAKMGWVKAILLVLLHFILFQS